MREKSEGPRAFSPRGEWERRVRVYYDPNDVNSLHCVVADRDTGDDYAASLRLPKPFNVPKYYRRDHRDYPY